MHTPDGFLTNWVCVVTFLITIGMIWFSVIRARKWMTKDKAFLMAGLAAIIFAFQMLNFSIGDGTSGHLIGGAIAAILLGPEAAVLVLSAVLLVQTFMYGDGGMLALGANILLMGIVAGYTAHYIHKPLRKKMPIASGVLASWGSVVAASMVAAILLGISGTISLSEVIPAMVLTHIFIGIGEGLITGGILFYVQRTKQGLLHKHEEKNISKYVVFSVLGAMAVLSFALPFASQNPDGLEKVALNLGFFEKATVIYPLSPLQDYAFFGQGNYLFVLLSGSVGMLLTFGVGYAMAKHIASPS